MEKGQNKTSEKTVFVVCVKEDQSFLYVCQHELAAHARAQQYEREYNTPCVVYEEILHGTL